VPHIICDGFGSRARRDCLRLVLGVLLLVALCTTAASAKKTPPTQPVDLTAATVKELEDLPGVGPTTAKAIVEFRTKSGRFRRVNDLLVIRGISEAKLAKMRPYVTVGPTPTPAPAKKPPPKPAPPGSPSQPAASSSPHS
jgi:competence ComEA-like helix-hairpin-helix protein